MRVRALQTFSTTSAKRAPGEEFDCSDAEGVAWLKAGLVQRVGEEVETATPREPETAVSRRGKR
jgi:hypothetical protein